MVAGVGKAAGGAGVLVALTWLGAVACGCRWRCDGRDGKRSSGDEERARKRYSKKHP